jgi:hypothetical protein
MGRLLNASSQMMCPHGGTVTASTSNSKARADSGFVLRQSDTFTIAGCVLNVAGAPHPCVRVQWVQPTLQNRAAGDSALAEESVGLCVAADQAVQGTVLVVFTQARVSGR